MADQKRAQTRRQPPPIAPPRLLLVVAIGVSLLCGLCSLLGNGNLPRARLMKVMGRHSVKKSRQRATQTGRIAAHPAAEAAGRSADGPGFGPGPGDGAPGAPLQSRILRTQPRFDFHMTGAIWQSRQAGGPVGGRPGIPDGPLPGGDRVPENSRRSPAACRRTFEPLISRHRVTGAIGNR